MKRKNLHPQRERLLAILNSELLILCTMPTNKKKSTYHRVRPEENVLLIACPRILTDGWVELIVPPLAALLARATVELGANDSPVLRAVLLHLSTRYICKGRIASDKLAGVTVS